MMWWLLLLLQQPHRLYHRETIEQLAAGRVPWPYVETTGRVRLVRLEDDGDLHIKLSGVTAYVVLEVIPCNRARSREYQRRKRRDELHPLLGWEAVPP